MFDLGCFRYQLFDCINRKSGYLNFRFKDNPNALITGTHRKSGAGTVSRSIEGHHIRCIAVLM